MLQAGGSTWGVRGGNGQRTEGHNPGWDLPSPLEKKRGGEDKAMASGNKMCFVLGCGVHGPKHVFLWSNFQMCSSSSAVPFCFVSGLTHTYTYISVDFIINSHK